MTTESVPALARYLQDQVGRNVAAYLTGVDDPRIVGRWVTGKDAPSEISSLRLRCAVKVVRVLVAAYDAATAEAWLFGTNSRLDDEAPAFLIRHAESWDDLKEILPTARAFAVKGT